MKKVFRFRKLQLDEVVRTAAKEAKNNGREVCGLLLDNGYFVELVQVENKVKRGGGFSFYFKEVRAIQKAANLLGHEIIGTFHSHPNYISSPGGSDVASALDDSFMLIVDVMARKLGFWHIKNRKAKEFKFEQI